MPAKILIVEDSVETSNLLMRILERAGYDVYHAAEGKSAVRIALQEHPDLVLLDLAIPELDGIEVCRSIRSHPATSQTKVIIVSGLKREEDMEEARSVGAVLYLTKPFLIDDLLESVRSVLETPAGAGNGDQS